MAERFTTRPGGDVTSQGSEGVRPVSRAAEVSIFCGSSKLVRNTSHGCVADRAAFAEAVNDSFDSKPLNKLHKSSPSCPYSVAYVNQKLSVGKPGFKLSAAQQDFGLLGGHCRVLESTSDSVCDLTTRRASSASLHRTHHSVANPLPRISREYPRPDEFEGKGHNARSGGRGCTRDSLQSDEVFRCVVRHDSPLLFCTAAKEATLFKTKINHLAALFSPILVIYGHRTAYDFDDIVQYPLRRTMNGHPVQMIQLVKEPVHDVVPEVGIAHGVRYRRDQIGNRDDRQVDPLPRFPVFHHAKAFAA